MDLVNYLIILGIYIKGILLIKKQMERENLLIDLNQYIKEIGFKIINMELANNNGMMDLFI